MSVVVGIGNGEACFVFAGDLAWLPWSSSSRNISSSSCV
jgi:hypothetical protein